MDALKKQIVKGFAFANNMDALKGNKVIIVTALGLISGNLCDQDAASQEISGVSVTAAICDQITEAYGTENIEGNDGYILLTDVTIRTGNGINSAFNIPSLVVFYDQIIGVTLGNMA